MGDRENILSALREKPLKIYGIMRRANIPNEEFLPVAPIENARRRFGEIRYPQGAMVHRIAMPGPNLARLDEQEPEDVEQHRDTEVRSISGKITFQCCRTVSTSSN